MCAKREDLEASSSLYQSMIEQATVALAEARVLDALDIAEKAWELVPDMMNFERKYEGKQFDSIEAISIVLNYAPLILDRGRLDRLESFLKKNKSVDRHASDDISGDVDASRRLLLAAYQTWKYYEQNETEVPYKPQDLQVERMSRQATSFWLATGLLREVSGTGQHRLTLAGDMGARCLGKCSNCGGRVTATKSALLRGGTCPQCKTTTVFTLLKPQ